MAEHAIRLVLADVDGTLVTPDKTLTPRAVDAVRSLAEAQIHFAVTSGRPPRGMSMLVEPLDLTTPLAAFNGGLLVDRDMAVLEQRSVAPEHVATALEVMDDHGLDTWIYQRAEWFVRDPDGPHVDKESRTVRFAPTVVEDYAAVRDDVSKIVGVSDDDEVMERALAAVREALGDTVAASRSQPYYLDVTNPDANKGAVVATLADRFDIPEHAVATLGDMPNDVVMFERSGLSIAMGNAERDVQEAADVVTAANSEEGFALAVERFILGT